MNKQMLLSQLDRSYRKLLDALDIPPSHPLAVDGTIQRFEFTYEIACETVNQFFRDNPIPRGASDGLRDALRRGLIKDQETWQSLMTLKQQTAYAFSELLALEIYNTIRENHHVFDLLIEHCRRLSRENRPVQPAPAIVRH